MTDTMNTTLGISESATVTADEDAKQESVIGNGVSSIAKDPMKFLEKLKPVFDLLEKARPYAEKGYDHVMKGVEIVRPYYDKYWDPVYAQVMFGFVLLFFGGNFAMTIACYTAVQISGLDLIKSSWAKLHQQYTQAKDAAESDEIAMGVLDADGDGRLSVQEMVQAGKKLATASSDEKWEMMMALKNVVLSVDPNQVANGVGGIWAAVLTVMATLRSAFAKDVALGVSIGGMLEGNVSKYIAPYLKSENDTKEVKVWKQFAVGFICRAFGVSLALVLARVVSALHSSITGGQILAAVGMKFLGSKGLLPLPVDPGSGDADQLMKSNEFFLVLSYALAAWGFVSQARAGFAVTNVLLRLILLPVVLLESILTIVAAY